MKRGFKKANGGSCATCKRDRRFCPDCRKSHNRRIRNSNRLAWVRKGDKDGRGTRSTSAVIRPFDHEYNGRVFQVVTYGDGGVFTGICNVCKTPEDAESFCREIGVTNIRREGC